MNDGTRLDMPERLFSEFRSTIQATRSLGQDTVGGGHLFTNHRLCGVADVHAATVPDFPYHAGIHVNYQETVLPMKDGLPKMKDYPAQMGGSGLTLAE